MKAAATRLTVVQDQIEAAAVAVACLRRDGVLVRAVACNEVNTLPVLEITPAAAERLQLAAEDVCDHGAHLTHGARLHGAIVIWHTPRPEPIL